MIRDKLPVSALPAASDAVARASELGHSIQVEQMRQLSRKVYATPCRHCFRLVIISDMPSLGWKAGGSATFEACDGGADY
jgi:hypothetical protein